MVIITTRLIDQQNIPHLSLVYNTEREQKLQLLKEHQQKEQEQ